MPKESKISDLEKEMASIGYVATVSRRGAKLGRKLGITVKTSSDSHGEVLYYWVPAWLHAALPLIEVSKDVDEDVDSNIVMMRRYQESTELRVVLLSEALLQEHITPMVAMSGLARAAYKNWLRREQAHGYVRHPEVFHPRPIIRRPVRK